MSIEEIFLSLGGKIFFGHVEPMKGRSKNQAGIRRACVRDCGFREECPPLGHALAGHGASAVEGSDGKFPDDNRGRAGRNARRPYRVAVARKPAEAGA